MNTELKEYHGDRFLMSGCFGTLRRVALYLNSDLYERVKLLQVDMELANKKRYQERKKQQLKK